MKILLQMTALCLILGIFFTGCKKNKLEEVVPTHSNATAPVSDPTIKTFDRNGVRMVLPVDFKDYSESPMGQAFEFLYAADFVGVYGTRTVKDSQLGLEMFSQANAAQWNTEAQQKNGIWTVYYVDETQNEPQAMVCAFYESEDAFWMIQAYCPQELFGEYEEFMYECVLAAQILE